MPHYLCTLVHGPTWDDSRETRQQDGWTDHAAFMDQLVNEGFTVVGGPVGSGDYTAHLVHASDEQQIRTRFADDPWSSDGHLAVGSIALWSLWLDGRTPARRATVD